MVCKAFAYSLQPDISNCELSLGSSKIEEDPPALHKASLDVFSCSFDFANLGDMKCLN